MIKADMKNIDFLFSVYVYKGNKDKDQVDMKGHSQNKSWYEGLVLSKVFSAASTKTTRLYNFINRHDLFVHEIKLPFPTEKLWRLLQDSP